MVLTHFGTYLSISGLELLNLENCTNCTTGLSGKKGHREQP